MYWTGYVCFLWSSRWRKRQAVTKKKALAYRGADRAKKGQIQPLNQRPLDIREQLKPRHAISLSATILNLCQTLPR